MVRPAAARPHPSLHAEPLARGNRSGQSGRFHALPLCVAARRAVEPAHRRRRAAAVIAALDGFELAATAWERAVLPARVDRYEPSMLDTLCLAGEVGWARLSVPTPTEAAAVVRLGGTTPIALFLREHGEVWQTLRRMTTAATRRLSSTRAVKIAPQRQDSRPLFARRRRRKSPGGPARSRRIVSPRVAAACAMDDADAPVRAGRSRRRRPGRVGRLCRTARDRPGGGRPPCSPRGPGEFGGPVVAAAPRRPRRAARSRRSRLRRGRCCGVMAWSSAGCSRARPMPRRGVSWRAPIAGSKPAAKSAAAGSSRGCRASSSRFRTRSTCCVRSAARRRTVG